MDTTEEGVISGERKDMSHLTSEQKTNRLGNLCYKDSCWDLFSRLESELMPFIKKRGEILAHDNETKILFTMNKFIEKWYENNNELREILKNIDKNCGVFDPLCLKTAHQTGPDGRCRCEVKCTEQREHAQQIIKREILDSDLPKPEHDYWEDNYFRRNVFHMLHKILPRVWELFTEDKIANHGALKEFVQKWDAVGPCLHVLWTTAFGTQLYKDKMPDICYYEKALEIITAQQKEPSGSAKKGAAKEGIAAKQSSQSKEHNMETQRDQLFQQVQKLCDENNRLIDGNKQLVDEKSRLTLERNKFIQEMNDISRDYISLKASFQGLGNTFHEQDQEYKRDAAILHTRIRELESTVHGLRVDKEQLTKTVASYMHKQIERDESNLENINAAHRPMKLMEEYETFCCNNWLEAKDELDEWAKSLELDENEMEELASKLLAGAVMTCGEFAANLYSCSNEVIAEIIADPMRPYVLQKLNMTETCVAVNSKTLPLDVDLKVQIAKMHRTSSDTLDFNDIARVLMNSDIKHELGIKRNDLLENEKLVKYYTSCLLLSWRMAVQQPPMSFKFNVGPDGKYVEQLHELHFNSANPKNPNARLHYYIHPALYHGKKLMIRAKIVLKVVEPSIKSKGKTTEDMSPGSSTLKKTPEWPKMSTSTNSKQNTPGCAQRFEGEDQGDISDPGYNTCGKSRTSGGQHNFNPGHSKKQEKKINDSGDKESATPNDNNRNEFEMLDIPKQGAAQVASGHHSCEQLPGTGNQPHEQMMHEEHQSCRQMRQDGSQADRQTEQDEYPAVEQDEHATARQMEQAEKQPAAQMEQAKRQPAAPSGHQQVEEEQMKGSKNQGRKFVKSSSMYEYNTKPVSMYEYNTKPVSLMGQAAQQPAGQMEQAEQQPAAQSGHQQVEEEQKKGSKNQGRKF